MSRIISLLKAHPVMTAAALLAGGGAIGATAAMMSRPAPVMAPAAPTTIAALPKNDASIFPGRSIVTVRGKVAEVYGNAFILQDATGRTLVQAGRHGSSAPLVKPGETVTVQGHFVGATLRPMFLVGADGKAVMVGRRGGHHGEGRHGRDHDDAGAPQSPPPLPAPEAGKPAPVGASSPTP